MKKMIAMLLCVLLLAGCTAPVVETTAPPEPEFIGNSPVPNIRTGIMEQALSPSINVFECTENGVYFLCHTDFGKDYILYADHGSDEFVKLCGRSDCTHSDDQCNAFIRDGQCLTYYEGYLYVTAEAYSGAGSAIQLFRMNLDGTERIKVADTINAASGYSGSYGSFLGGGVMIAEVYKLDGDGKEVSKALYYKLDGSMDEFAELDVPVTPHSNHGYALVVNGASMENELPLMGNYMLDLNKNEAVYLSDFFETCIGYVGAEAYYYISDGVIYRQVYATGEREIMLDTGLVGNHRLHGFPDGFVISEDVAWEDLLEGVTLESQTLSFYNWDFEYLDEVFIDYPIYSPMTYDSIIVGETEERILLGAHDFSYPTYYIDKSEIGTGNIQLHEFKLPEGIIDEDKFLEPWEE